MRGSKPKYDYDIEKIEPLINEGLSERAIARKFKWCEINFHRWINRNYIKVIRYIKRG